MKRRWDRVMDRDCDHVPDRNDLAVSVARLQASPKGKSNNGKPKLKPAEYAERLAIEKALQQRRYCNAFALWRTCRDKRCRRQGACCGDANACLKRSLAEVPHNVQWRVRETILDATPANIGAPERQARQCMPRDLHE
jgi:hypothetical protein